MTQLGALGLALVLAGSLPVLAASKAGPAAGKTVKIGAIADVTGTAGAYGTAQKNAYELASENAKSGAINTGGATLTFEIADAASDPAQVASAFQRFTTDGTAVVLGPTLSSEAKKADPIAVRANLTILATSNTAQGITEMGPCVFRDSLSEEQVVPEMVRKADAKWKIKSAAIIYGDDDQFTKTDYEIFKNALDQQHINIVDVETFHKGDVDFNAQLTKIKSKNPDVIVVGALLEEAVKIITQARKLGIQAHLMGGNGLNSPRLATLAGPAAYGTVVGAAWYIDSDTPGNKQFVDAYKKRFNLPPDQFAAQSYAAAQIVAHAVSDGATTSAQLCDAFKKMKPVPTVLGPVNFDAQRNANAPSVVLEVAAGGFKLFR